MKLTIVAVGRLRAGPEATLISDYLSRLEKTGRALGLGQVEVIEVEAKKSGGDAEAEVLSKALGHRSPICCLDERGRTMTSPDFAAMLADWRDHGGFDPAFVIGGPDGLDTSLTSRADRLLSFGPMVWPHMLVRVMLAEQLYRAASILAGSPYHRV